MPFYSVIFAGSMLRKSKGIVLHTVKYSDKSNIVHIYTEQGGRMSFLIPASRSRKSAVNGLLFQPLSLVEFEADIRPRSGLHHTGSEILAALSVVAL